MSIFTVHFDSLKNSQAIPFMPVGFFCYTWAPNWATQ